MTVAEAILCGIVQGLSEFLPISSSGHLSICHALFHMEDATMTFDILLHLGTLFVVIAFFYREICSLVPAFFSLLWKILRGKWKRMDYNEKERYVIFLMVATLPLVLAPFFQDRVEAVSSYTKAVGCILIGNGLLLLFADRMAEKIRRKEMNGKAAFGIGCMQLLAILPGLSRSGSTVAGGLLFGQSREEAVRFSFLMSIPAVVGANLMALPDVMASPLAKEELGICLVGMAAAVVTGFLAMKLLLYTAKREKFGFFAYYTMTAGLLTVIFL